MARVVVDFVIVDAHVHFWDPGELDYPWLDAVPSLRCPALPAAYHAAGVGADVDRVIVVEGNCAPLQSGREVELLERLAEVERTPRIAGIVAFVDLTEETTRDAALEAMGNRSRVKGVRQNIQGQEPGFCLQSSFVDGVRAVGRRGLAFDVCITHDQLTDAIDLVSRCPDVRFVLDHCGKPAIRHGEFAAWASDIARLARFDNVWCKISGLFTEAGTNRSDETLLRYARHAVDCFDTDRVMYGSDWPVLTLAAGDADWHQLTRTLTADWSESDARRFYGDTATRVYRL